MRVIKPLIPEIWAPDLEKMVRDLQDNVAMSLNVPHVFSKQDGDYVKCRSCGWDGLECQLYWTQVDHRCPVCDNPNSWEAVNVD